jgi:two-component sensor histidine kinase
LISQSRGLGDVYKRQGEVRVIATRGDSKLHVVIADNGPGFESGTVGQGLGTQIIRTLVENALSATIEWNRGLNGGTEVSIDIPLRFIQGPRRA